MIRAAVLAIAALCVLATVATAAPRTIPGAVVRVEHRDPNTVPTRGLEHAPVTLEVFFSPQLAGRSRPALFDAIDRLVANHPTRIRVVYRVMRRASVQLSTLALEAHAQGKFFELLALLHEPTAAGSPSTSIKAIEVMELARRLGMDLARTDAALKAGRYRDVLDANDARFERLHGGSLPLTMFNSQPARGSLSAPSDAELERAYAVAFERAQDLLDRGVDPRELAAAFDAQALRARQPFVINGPAEDDGDDEDGEARATPDGDPVLASPPLALAGLPSYGNPGVRTRVPVAVLCRPTDSSCRGTLRVLERLALIYDLQLAWAPWFDVAREDAVELTLLGDAALCAEELGSGPEDRGASPGWAWITTQLDHIARASARRTPTERLLDAIAATQGIDRRALAACRARMAGTTLGWIERARRAGVARAPAVVIGGRIYEGLADQTVLQQLIEAELAPGVLGALAPSPRR